MRRFLLLTAVAAAVGVMAAMTSTASATAYGNIVFFTGGDGTANWVVEHADAHSAIQLTAPDQTSYSDYAGFEIRNVGTTAPTVAPTFTTSSYAAGSPRWVIEFAGGAYLWGYPSPFSQWQVAGCNSVGFAYTDYATALAALQGGTQSDGSSGTAEYDTITNVTYDGKTYVG